MSFPCRRESSQAYKNLCFYMLILLKYNFLSMLRLFFYGFPPLLRMTSEPCNKTGQALV
ncbi:MAG: hypothetical protein ACEY3D_07380 [Rickettsia sp.]|uniref:hypothetical protein n=1 Tax=Rickettsia sp. TaxID=789 RepID=UPI00397B5634